MEVIVNATLAGGVAMGTIADFCLIPGAPLVIGMVVGAISSYGFLRINSYL